MAANSVGWFEIYVDEIARARLFYESVIKVQLVKLGDPNDSTIETLAFPSVMGKYGATGALVKMNGFPAGGIVP